MSYNYFCSFIDVKSYGTLNSIFALFFSNGVAKDANPFDEEEEDEEWDSKKKATASDSDDDDDDINAALVDTGEPGVKVRALYDYDAAEEDELGFKTGDIFEKLEDEDAQGWCKGRKDGRVGLYPANYIELVQ